MISSFKDRRTSWREEIGTITASSSGIFSISLRSVRRYPSVEAIKRLFSKVLKYTPIKAGRVVSLLPATIVWVMASLNSSDAIVKEIVFSSSRAGSSGKSFESMPLIVDLYWPDVIFRWPLVDSMVIS